MTNPVALITGGAKRVGAALCKALHSQGFNIVIHYNNSRQQAEALCRQLNASRRNSAISLAAHLGNNPAIKTLAERASLQWGRLDTLINNASSFYPTAVDDASESQWDELFNSNVKGAFFLSQALAPHLRKNHGCIVNIVDIHAQKPLKGHSIYCMAKAALAMMTQALAKELAPVRVNGVSPGAILWPENLAGDILADNDKQQIIKKIPLAHAGKPEDIAKTVLFLINAAPYITGQIVAVDGGRTLSM